MDYDGDGDLDILSGSYTGEIYLFEGAGDRTFAQGRFLLNRGGDPLEVASSVTPEAVDYDGDGDLDLIIGTRSSGVKLVLNEGTRQEPIWAVEHLAVMTKDGSRVKGSNAHHADWDGDGLRDLIVGSENGGAYWYRNEGKNDSPVYGEQQVLVAKGKFEERSEEEGTLGPGLRTKVHVADYNNDGRKDLLIGDVQWFHEKLPPLTEEQKAEKKAIKPEYDRLNQAYKAIVNERNKFVGKPGGIPQEVLDAMADARADLDPVGRIWRSFKRTSVTTHGYVWLCLRGEEQSGAVEAASVREGSTKFGPTTFKVVATPIEGKPGQVSVLAHLTIDEGWHVYAELPDHSDYIQVRPSLTLPKGAEQLGTWTCNSESIPDPHGDDAEWFVKQASFTCVVQLPENSTSGIKAAMRFQVCDEQMCMPPHTSKVSLD